MDMVAEKGDVTSGRFPQKMRASAAIIGVSEETVSRMKRGDFQLEPGTKPFELGGRLGIVHNPLRRHKYTYGLLSASSRAKGVVVPSPNARAKRSWACLAPLALNANQFCSIS